MFLKTVKLERFFGFPKVFTLELENFTAMVGPNNGGKTTILRAIKFATDAFRVYFGDGPEPNLGQMSSSWIWDLNQIGQRLGILDLSLFYFSKNRDAEASVTLSFMNQQNQILLTTICQPNQNNIAIRCSVGDQAIRNRGDEEAELAIKKIYAFQALFIPPLGTLSPTEAELSWPNVRQALAEGKYAETWRNQLHWLNDGLPTGSFQQLTKVIGDYLPSVTVHPPRRTKEHSPPHVIVDYSERGVEYDVSAAGGGMRSLISLASALELSPASILLFDEPDAHLHSSVQRQVVNFLVERANTKHQILIATHAPDVIDELPLESLRWIDRNTEKAMACDDVGKVLINLGAISASQAVQTLGADVVLFFEDKPDRKALKTVMTKCGKEGLAERSRLALLKGIGNAAHLPAAIKILKAIMPIKVAVAAILDADYLQLQPQIDLEDQGQSMIFRLPCKELENLLLFSATTIADAAKRAAAMRATQTGEPAKSPSEHDVENQIFEITQALDVKRAVEDQWRFRWLQENGGLADPGQLKQSQDAFERCWSSLDWRRRCCPGKRVLTHIKQWLQGEPFKLSLSLFQLFDAFQPTQEIQDLFDRLQDYVDKVMT